MVLWTTELIHTVSQLLLFGLCFGLLLIGDKIGGKKMKAVLGAALVLFMCGYVYTKTTTGSLYISYVMIALILCAATLILGLLPFTALDYAVLFAALLLLNISYFFSLAYMTARHLMLLLIYILLVYCRLKKIKGHLFHIWLNFTIAMLLYIAVGFVFDSFVRHIGYSFTSPLSKIVVWGAASVVISAVSALLIYGLKYWCHDYFNELNDMGKKYPSIERYFITLSAGLLLFYTAAQMVVFSLFRYDSAIEPVLNTVYLLSIFLQLLFLTQLFRLSHLRESLSAKEIENMSLLSYSSDLERNFSEIKDIKHDIKNLFFTMGQYVEKSGDEAFKRFYNEKIFPFAEGEIQKNDLYQKLLVLENEQLRAFLYYKLTQAHEHGVPVAVEITPGAPSLSMPMPFSDIVRILGILIDNALEESLLLEKNERAMIVSLTGNDKIVSVKIQNKVRSETLAAGVKPGISQKGGDRGRGLYIVNKIVSKYDFAALNSYFKDSCFVQNLMIYIE